jgi:hypothetical protein
MYDRIIDYPKALTKLKNVEIQAVIENQNETQTK